ncbi:hypothetical protein OAA52_00625 [Planktomarina temperata]|nr:hypothetical protein [Planktomarina temperata]
MASHELSTFPSINNLSLIQDKIDFFVENGYGSLNFDAIYKWCTIWLQVETFCKQSTSPIKLLDIGGGLGPLDQIFTRYGQVFSIDIKNDRETWFPTNQQGFYSDSLCFHYDEGNLNRICANFWDIERIFEKNVFDVVYDGCSLIHFSNYGRNSDTALSVHLSMKIIRNLMKKEGVFVTACDVAHPQKYEYRDMIFPDNLLLGITSAGFEPVNKFDVEIDKWWRTYTLVASGTTGHLYRSLTELKSSDECACGLLSHKYKGGRADVAIEVVTGTFVKSDKIDESFVDTWTQQVRRANWKQMILMRKNYVVMIGKNIIKYGFRRAKTIFISGNN